MEILSRNVEAEDNPDGAFGFSNRKISRDTKPLLSKSKDRAFNKVETKSDTLKMMQRFDQTLVSKRDATSINRHGYTYFEKFKNETARLRTFDNNWPKDTPVSKAELAKGGWFYLGHQDKVQCPWCFGKLYSWEKGDTALGEHAKLFPSCSFVKQTVQSYLEPMAVKSNIPHGASNYSFATQKNEITIDGTFNLSGGASNYSDDIVESKQTDRPIVEAVTEVGFTKQQVEEAMRRLTSIGLAESTIDTDVIIDEILNDTSAIAAMSPVNHDVTDANEMEAHFELPKKCELNPNPVKKEQFSEYPEFRKLDFSTLKSQTSDFKNNVTCKICLDEKVGELFLPCRHLVCCIDCAASVSNCPLCRERIAGTIKAFI